MLFQGSASMNSWTPPSRSVALISNLSRASLRATVGLGSAVWALLKD